MNDEEIFEVFAITRGLSEKSRTDYIHTFKIYTKTQQMTLQELLDEAEQEEIEGIRLKNRTIKKRLISYKNYLIENYTKNSIDTHFTRVKALYKHFEIELPNFPNYKTKQIREYEPIYYKDLPDREIIKEALNISNPLMTAIILFMSSSGCARRETLNITINDFKKSIQDYTIKTNIYEILDDLKTKKNIVPMFRIKRQKTNKFYYTFCSPEATNAIISYLLSRNDILTDDSQLFKINVHYFTDCFNEINDKLNLGKVGAFNLFRSHMLRKYHASNLMMGEHSLTLDEIDSLQGRSKDKTHRSYFMEDPYKLKEKYVLAMPQIMINAEIIEVNSPKVQKILHENELLKAEREEFIEKTKEENKKMVLDILREHNAL